MMPLELLSKLDSARAEFTQTKATLVSLKGKEAAMGKREKEAPK